MKNVGRSPRSALTRSERAAQARRRRALSHLERVQGRGVAVPAGVSWRRLALPSFACGVAAGLGVGALALAPGPLQVIAVRGAQQLAPEEVARASGLEPGAELAALDRNDVAERLTSHAWIAGARTLPLPGGRLVVSVLERRAAAVLAGDEAWAVDAEGVPFAPAPEPGDPDLTRLSSAVAPTPGEADPALAAAVALARALPDHGLPAPREVSIAAPDDPEGFALRLPELAARVVLGRDDLNQRLDALRELLEARLPEVTRASRIDLRFEDQAVLDVSPPGEGAAQAAASRGHAAPSTEQPTG